jgi:3-keto-5-aminohexanoate cleavage enzyme
VRVGLEDAPFGTAKTNRALVEEAVDLVRKAGAEPATVKDMHAVLAQAGQS